MTHFAYDETNDFKYMKLFIFCTFVQQNIFISFHISNIKNCETICARSSVRCACLWCESVSTLRINKMLKRHKTMDGFHLHVYESHSFLFFSSIGFVCLSFLFCLTFIQKCHTICVMDSSEYVCTLCITLNICILLPRWCLVSCQSIFYNVAFRSPFFRSQRKCAVSHPPFITTVQNIF